jgi:hypothetical protein
LVSRNIRGQNIGLGEYSEIKFVLVEYSETKAGCRRIFGDKRLISWNIRGQKLGLVEYSGTKIVLVEYSGINDWSGGIFGAKDWSCGIFGDKSLVS